MRWLGCLLSAVSWVLVECSLLVLEERFADWQIGLRMLKDCGSCAQCRVLGKTRSDFAWQ